MTAKHAQRRYMKGELNRLSQTDPQPLSASVRRGALWSVAATLLLRLSGIFSTVVVAHILDRRDFGIFTIALTAYTIVLTVGELGIVSCLIRADLDIDLLAPTLMAISVTTNVIQAGLMYVFARSIAAALGSVAATSSIRILALTMIIAGIVAVPDCQLIRNFKQNRLFLAQASGAVPSILVLLLLVKTGSGATAFAWSMVVGLFISTCVVFASMPKYYLPRIRRSALSVLFRFGLPLGAANIVSCILLNVDYALIGHLTGAIALGAYVLAFNVATWPASLLGNVVSWVSMPVFSRIKHDADLLRSGVASALRSFSLIVMPMSALIITLSHPLILTLYGAKWTASAEILPILAIYGGTSIICVLFANILAGLGRSKSLFIVQLVWLGALFPAMMLGVRRGGILGAAVAHVFVICLVVLPCYLGVLKRTTGIRFTVLAKAVLPALLASSAAALAAKVAILQFTDSPLQLVIGLAAGGIVYVSAVAPQAIELLNRGRSSKLYATRILCSYNRAVRTMGLPGYNRAKHSRRGSQQRGQKTRARRETQPKSYTPSSSSNGSLGGTASHRRKCDRAVN